jgi:N-acetylneuraminate synthase
VTASVTTSELAELVRGVRFIDGMLAHPVDKDFMALELEPLRRTFGKSLVARVPLRRGTVLEREHLTARKPGTGIPADQLDGVLGSRLRRDVAADAALAEADLDREA